jgi:anaphase-promoting complex subunit 4
VEKLLHLKADLPHYLSTVDIETSLPKLATLPPTGVGVDDDVFSSRGSVDVIFHGGGDGNSGGKGGVDVLMVGLSDESGCKVHLKIFDAFEVGTVDVRDVLPEGETARVVRMESHPLLSTIFLVVEMASANDSRDSSLHLLGLDLSFIPQTGLNLPLVAKKATQLGNLLRYMSQVQMQLVAEVKAAFDLPTKFLRNVNESLAEADENADFVYAAHHLAVTGDCDPKLKEWLVDEVGDRGLKRWEKAVGDCFEVVRRMTSECLVPALERCLILLSRLEGLARFGPTSSKLGLDEKSITKVTETVDSMGVLAEDLLIDVGLEMREFAAFMKWLKWECEVEALEEGSERAAELRESWTGEGELKTVLEYVVGPMKESRLKKYLVKEEEDQPAGVSASFDDDPDIGFFAEYTKRRASGRKHKRMPTLGDLVARMQKQCDSVFVQIAETFRKSILESYLTILPQQCDGSNMDIKVIPDETDLDLHRLIVLSGHREKNDQVLQVVVTLRQDATKTFKHTINTHTLVIPDARGILDAKFVDDKEFLVLVETASDVRIYSHEIMDEDDTALGWRHGFENGQMKGLRPARLDVNGRVGRRVVAVLDRDGLGYAVFDLDAEDDAGNAGGGGDSFMTG